MFGLDIRPSLEGQGFFEYIFWISKIILQLIVLVQAMGHKAYQFDFTVYSKYSFF